MTDLLSVLRAEGLHVAEIGHYAAEPAAFTDWRTRHRSGGFAPVGVIVHHTAGTKSLHTVVVGRSDLAGPLCDLHMPKDGTVNLVSDGRANHAGPGSSTVLVECKRDIAPSGDAKDRHLRDDTTGNGDFYGLECENLGDGNDPWPATQLDSIARACAAICRWHGWSANRVIGHREWTARKPDPRGFSMTALRHLVADHIHGAQPVPVPGPGVPPPVHISTIGDDVPRQQDYVNVPAPSTDNDGDGAFTLPYPFGRVGAVVFNEGDQNKPCPSVTSVVDDHGMARAIWKRGGPNMGAATLIVEHWT